MATQGPLFPGTTATLANAGTSENAEAWVNPGNIVSDNATEAAITAATYDSPDISQLLVASNFGFTIPAGSTIDGITVEVDRRSIILNSGKDFRVQLSTSTAFAGLVGTNKAVPATIWPTTSTVATYGGSADTWTAGLAVAQVNAAGFAVMLSCQANIANADVGVDYIRVTVDYTPPTTFDRTTDDTISLSEAAARVFSALRLHSDTTTLSEALTRAATAYARTTQDSVSGSDSVAGARGFARFSSDAVTGSDSVTRSVTDARTASDSTSASEVVSRAASARGRTSSDTTTLSDALARSAGSVGRLASDTTGLTDALVGGSPSVPRALIDSVTSSDALSELRSYVRSSGDAVATADEVLRSVVADRAAEDTEALNEVVAFLVALVRTASDQVTDSDSLAVTPPEPIVDRHQGWVGAGYRSTRAGAKIRRRGSVGTAAR